MTDEETEFTCTDRVVTWYVGKVVKLSPDFVALLQNTPVYSAVDWSAWLPTEEDRAIHAAIGRIQSNDDKRLGCAQYLGDDGIS